MAEQPQDRLEGRNGDVWRAHVSGATQEAIAAKLGVSQATVSRIIAQVRDTIPAPVKEHLVTREMDFLDGLRAEMMELAAKPPPPAFSQRGIPLVDPDTGQIVRDASTQLAAIDRAVKLHERMSKILGLEAPSRAEVAVTAQAQQAAQALAAEALAELHGDAE